MVKAQSSSILQVKRQRKATGQIFTVALHLCSCQRQQSRSTSFKIKLLVDGLKSCVKGRQQCWEMNSSVFPPNPVALTTGWWEHLLTRIKRTALIKELGQCKATAAHKPHSFVSRAPSLMSYPYPATHPLSAQVPSRTFSHSLGSHQPPRGASSRQLPQPARS